MRKEATGHYFLTYKPLLAILALSGFQQSSHTSRPECDISRLSVHQELSFLFSLMSPSATLQVPYFPNSQAYPNPKYPGEKLQPEPHRSHYGLRGTSGEQELKGLGLYQWRAHKLTHTQTDPRWVSSPLWDYFFLKGCSFLGSTAILKLLFEDDGCCQ